MLFLFVQKQEKCAGVISHTNTFSIEPKSRSGLERDFSFLRTVELEQLVDLILFDVLREELPAGFQYFRL